MTAEKRGPVLGIDLGTITTLAAICPDEQSEPVIIRPHLDLPEYENDWLPSLVCLTDGEPLVGERALRYADNPLPGEDWRLIRCIKREMALANKRYQLGGQSYTPIDISAILLRHLREAAAKQVQLPVEEFREAVVTVPAYFGQAERMNTRKAGEKAGFKHVHLLDEPVAAALGLRVDELPGNNLILVIDLGGGTLDVTLLRAGCDVPDGGIYELSRDGDGFLGGIDWDLSIAMFALENADDPWDWQSRVGDERLDFLEPSNTNLFLPCEKAKWEFCIEQPPPVIKFFYMDKVERETHYVKMTHDQFLQCTRDLRQRCINVCNRLLREVPRQELCDLARPPTNLLQHVWPERIEQLEWRDIQHIYMVGGGSRVRSVQEDIWKCWPHRTKEPQLADRPELQVVFGAARCAASPDLIKQLERMCLRCPHTLGIWHRPSPRRSLIERVFRRSSHGNGDREGRPQKQFYPLILKNERIPAAPCVEATVAGQATLFQAVLVEQRLDPSDPDIVEHRELAKLTVPLSRNQPCKPELELRYHSDRDMTFAVRVGTQEEEIQPTAVGHEP